MATMDTTYLPSGALQTTTSGEAAGGGGGDMMAMLLPMLKDSLARKERLAAMAEIDAKKQRAAAAKPGPVAINRAYDNPVQRAAGGGGGNREAAPLDQLSAQRASMEAEGMMLDRLPAPIKYVGGAGIIAGPTMDTMAMNARQRRNFLPGSSQEGPSESAANRNREAIEKENAAGRKERTDARGDMDYYGQLARNRNAERGLGMGGY